ncbi:hypothetical protein C1645_837491 [Glomus cerebriforme]|uniref:BTB/POZ domain-containing protein n=1 Tax=Glomus cerebriforme TaxID=658196 RepID=A0A397SED8_9GLOM|nr:hypothetical protein C1645_837491 [Glomus cerebriforme]
MSRKFVTKALSKLKIKKAKETETIEAKETKTKETEETEVDYDVIIYVGEEPDFKEFYSHSETLCSKSDYFKKLLSDKDIEKKDEKYVIKEPNITPQVFDVIIKYLSTGQVNVSNKSGIEILNIIIASDDLKLNQFVKLAQDSLIEHRKFLQNDPIGIFQMIYNNKALKNIQELCLEKICYEPEILFNSDKFVNLPAPPLEIILKRNDVNLEEIEIWEYLIKWALAQEKTLNDDISKWNQENFIVFERIFHKFIPLIRFYDISSEDYYYKVRPYEKILPKELQEEILKFHMIPGYVPTFNISSRRYVDSVLINQKHIAIFANWIDKEGGSKKYADINYKFNLLYRASRDGNTAAAFHKKCNNKGATIVVVKIKGTKRLVGGYNPLDWFQSNSYTKSTQESFIFYFNDYRDINTGKIGRVINATNALICNNSWGPIFGNTFINGSYDLVMNSNSKWSSISSDYPNLNIPSNFEIDDYEAFQIVKK